MLLINIVGLLGVALGMVTGDQSESTEVDEQPIGTQEITAQKRRIDTPEVVLQLKYNRGELNKIYLAQFRKPKNGWSPSVSARSDLCTDLCHAGLGGDACGLMCSELMPIGLKTALSNSSNTETRYGHPRVEVCPALCHNGLGSPLCSCRSNAVYAESEDEQKIVDWGEVCNAFCITGSYIPRGCSVCDTNAMIPTNAAFRVLDTAEGWVAWCNVQCRQGQGGAACNCDRSPL